MCTAHDCAASGKVKTHRRNKPLLVLDYYGFLIHYSMAVTFLVCVATGNVSGWCGMASQVALVVKNPPANAVVRDVGLIPGWGRSPGGGQGSPLQYSCLENPMDRGVWQATVHRVIKS